MKRETVDERGVAGPALLFRMLLGAFLVCTMAGCGFYMKYKSSTASMGYQKQHPHDYTLEFSGIKLHVRPYNEVQTFQVTYFVILPIYIKTKDTPTYPIKPFTVLMAFMPLRPGFGLNPGDIALHLEDKIYHPMGLSARLKLVPGPESDFYRDERARGRVLCGRNPSGEFQPITGDVKLAFDRLDVWYCYEVQFDVTAPDPSVPFSISFNGLLRNGDPYAIPTIPFHERRWSHTDSVP